MDAGRGKLLFFDCPSGIAGDMTVAALLDLGVPLDVVEQALGALALRGWRLEVGRTARSGIGAAQLAVHVEPGQPERSFRQIQVLLGRAPLSSPVRALARRIFRRLGEAEASVHGVKLDDVHFHEVGAVDAIVDVVATAAAIAHLGARVLCSPLPMGHGIVAARHGPLPLPAPAVIECLRGVPTYGVEIEAELVTPTGAAIAAALAEGFTRWPAIAPERAGYGAGRTELADRPNLLRAVLGSPAEPPSLLWGEPSHVVIEANVDDMTGELAAHAIAELLASGALDAWAAPITMKKGRPALTIAALVPRLGADQVAEVMLRETTSFGVRCHGVQRRERARRTVRVETRYGPLGVKVGHGGTGPAQVKPEFDDCARAAQACGVPLRAVIAAALAAYEAKEGGS